MRKLAVNDAATAVCPRLRQNLLRELSRGHRAAANKQAAEVGSLHHRSGYHPDIAWSSATLEPVRRMPHLFVALCKPTRIVCVKTVELTQCVCRDGVVLQVKGGQDRTPSENAGRYRLQSASRRSPMLCWQGPSCRGVPAVFRKAHRGTRTQAAVASPCAPVVGSTDDSQVLKPRQRGWQRSQLVAVC